MVLSTDLLTGQRDPEELADWTKTSPIIKTATNHSTGERLGWDGSDWIPIRGTATNKDTQEKIAILLNGSYRVYSPEIEPKEGEGILGKIWNPTSRAMGILFGLGNAIPAFILGGLEVGEEEELKKLGAFGKATVPIGAGFSAAWDSISKKGDWGTTYNDYVKAVTGKGIVEAFDDMIGTEKEKGTRHNMFAAKKFLSELSEPTLEILVGLALDPAVTGPAVFSGLRKSLPEISAAMKPRGVAPGFVRQARETELIRKGRQAKGEFKKLARQEREVKSLLKNRQGTLNAINQIKKNKQLYEVNRNLKPLIETEMRTQQDLAARIQIINMRKALEDIIKETKPAVKKVEPKQTAKFTGKYMFEGTPNEYPLFRVGEEVSDIGPKGLIERGIEVPKLEPIKPDLKLVDVPRMNKVRKSIGETKPVEQEIKEVTEALPEADLLLERISLMKRRGAKLEAAGLKEPTKTLTKEQKASLKAMDDYLDYHSDIEKGKDPSIDFEVYDDLPEFDLDFLGMNTIAESISKGVKAGTNLYKRIRGIDVDAPGQVDDVLELVQGMYETQYGGKELARPSYKSIFREEAGYKGYTYKFDKNTGKYTLIKEGKTKSFTSRNKLSEFLGLGKSIKDYRNEVHALNIQTAAEESKRAFMNWAFPGGMETVTPQQAWEAAQRLEKFLKNRRKFKRAGDRWIKAQDSVLGRTPVGKKFSETLMIARDEGEIGFAKDVLNKEKILKGVNAKDRADVRMVLDGYGKKIKNKRIHELAQKLRPDLTDAYQRAVAANIPVEKFRNEYFPHDIIPLADLKKGGRRIDAMLSEGVREGRFKDLDEARKTLKGYISRTEGNLTDMRFINWLAEERGISKTQALKIWERFIAPNYNRVTGHLIKPRRMKDNPFYGRNLDSALGGYYMEVNRSIANVRHFGLNKEIARSMIDRIRLEGGNWKIADEILERYTNPMDFDKPEGLARSMMTFQLITKLNPLTTLVNMSQNLATALRTSPTATLKAIVKYDKEFARESGAIINSTIRDIMEAHGATGSFGSMYLRAIGFTKSEEILRTVASNAGKYRLQQLTKKLLSRSPRQVKLAKRQIRWTGLDPDKILKRGRATNDELLQAGKRTSDQTQFRGDKFDLPLEWLGPTGRVATQYKTFVFNQAKLIKKSVIDEARQGNFRPLIFLLTAYPIAGAGYTALVDNVILGKESPDSIPEWYWRGLTAVGGLGLFQTALESVTYGKKAVLELIGGPTAADIATFSQFYRVFMGESFNLTKELGGRLPFLGRVVKAHIKDQRKGRQRRTSRGR